MDGIQAVGFVHGVVLEDIGIVNMTGRGVSAVPNSSGPPYSWRGTRIVAKACRGHGFALGMTDSTWIDLQAIGCGGSGFRINGAANSHVIGCRAEWNAQHGFEISGHWWNGHGAGGLMLTGCSSDRNTRDGVHLSATGNAPVLLNGLMLRRDGRNGGAGGGGFAGLRVDGATVPVVVNGISVFPGTDDSGGGDNSPEFAVSVSDASFVTLNGGWLHAEAAPIHDGGGNAVLRIDPAIGSATGPTGDPAAATTTATVPLGVRPAGDTADRLTATASGALGWGSGTSPADVLLHRPQAGVLATDGVFSAAGGLGLGDLPAGAPAPIAGTTSLFSRHGVLTWTDPGGRDHPLDDSLDTGPRPTDQGFAAWNYDPLQAVASTVLVSGTVYLAQLWIRRSTVVSRLWVGLAEPGSGLDPDGCRLGLVDGAGGALLDAADAGPAFGGEPGAVSAPLGSARTLAPGRYYLALLANGANPPALARTAGTVPGLANRPNPGATTARFAVHATGRATLPTGFPAGSDRTTAAGIGFWVAVD